MADKSVPAEKDEDVKDDAAEEAAVGKPKSKKKKLILVAVVLLLLGGGGAAATFGGFLKKGGDDKTAKETEVPAANVEASVFHDLPDILVNLDNTGKQAHFLKLKVSLELGSKADEQALDKAMPRVIDQFQTYLRELRTDDLKGSAGVYRLRQELLTRVAAASQPIDVRDVLFREILIQ